jgi:hypothetical protein
MLAHTHDPTAQENVSTASETTYLLNEQGISLFSMYNQTK